MKIEGRKKPCAIFVANRGFALLSSRLLLLTRFVKKGWRVVAATADDEHAKTLREYGIIVEPVEFVRSGFAPRRDWKAFRRLCVLYRNNQPRLIHHFHAKPIILGGAAARRVAQAKVVHTVTGLGHAFVAGRFARHLLAIGYKQFLDCGNLTVFQNSDDRDFFLQKGWILQEYARLIVSSGVDITRFQPGRTLLKRETPRVLMVARLLREKGVYEFVEAAEICRKRHPLVRFQLAGEWDHIHPDAIKEECLREKTDSGVIEFLGFLDNIHEILPLVTLFVLPSYYREGIPRVILEAAACGIPVITTDVPGCREAIEDGVTGRLVPPRDSGRLAEAIQELLDDPKLCERMSRASRVRVEKKFDIRMITDKYLDVYREIGIDI